MISLKIIINNIITNQEDILLIILITAFAVQIFYQLYFFLRLSFHKNTPPKYIIPLSIIIASRNEFENLKKNLPLFLNQKYPEFEVIVVNDRSWDQSSILLNELKKEYDNLKVVEITDNGTDHFAKKLALTIGIKASKYNHFIFSDADCFPNSNLWLKEISGGFQKKKEIILGGSTYKRQKGLLNKLIRFDTAHIATMYLSMAKAKIPYMGVGRNLGYNNDIYEKVRGFKSHYHIPSGDDDLFVNEGANKHNTSVILTKKSITVSNPKTSFKDWFIQKRRHHMTNHHYKFKHKLLLIIYPVSMVIFYFSCFYLAYLGIFKHLIIYLIISRNLLLMLVFFKPFKNLLCIDLLIASPIYEIILLFCYPVFQIKPKKAIK